jgi:hypothetical protein
VVRKRGEDFALEGAMAETALPVGAVELGHVHPVVSMAGLEGRVGARAALNVVGDDLESRYGTRTPFGLMIYLQVIPTAPSR